MPRRNRTGSRQIQFRKRRAQAVTLREQDVSYSEIARQLGCSASTAYEMVQKGIEELKPIEDAKIMRQLKLGRLEGLIEIYYPQAKTDPAAAKTYLTLEAEHSKLAGLYPEPGDAAANIDQSTHNKTLNIVLNPPINRDDDRTELPPIPRLTQQEHHDEINRGAFPHRVEHQKAEYAFEAGRELQEAPAAPEPAATPTNYKQRRAALAERAKLEGWPTSNAEPTGPWSPPKKKHWMA